MISIRFRVNRRGKKTLKLLNMNVVTKNVIHYYRVCLIQCFVQAAVREFLDLEAIASDDHSTDSEEQESDRAYYPYFSFILIFSTFNRGFYRRQNTCRKWIRRESTASAFVSVTSRPLRGTMGWVERIVDDIVYLLKYKEECNNSTSFDDTMVSFILIPVDIC